MKGKETANTFHQRLLSDCSTPGQFTIYRNEDYCSVTPLLYTRRDFYKISLVAKGEGLLTFAGKSYLIKDNVLVFFNPMIPYSWEPAGSNDKGYSCLFTEDFINYHRKTEKLSASPLFKTTGNHVLAPDQKTMDFLSRIFEQMMEETQSSYENKYELLRSYLQIIIHESLKIEPKEVIDPGNSNTRISKLFLDLLEKQFPIASLQHTLTYKNANEFARCLNIHTNHLNRALKETTGSTTTELIATRITTEAKALLGYTNWNIAEISFCLGFEHAANFNTFFKRQTGLTPSSLRKVHISIS